MSARITEARPASTRWSLDDDTRQLIAVVVMAAVALAAGAVLSLWATGQSRTVEEQGVSAVISSDWIAQQGVGDVILIAYDPQDPSLRYSVSRARASAGAAPGQVADMRITARSGVLPAFSVLDRGTTSVGGQPAEQVTFTYAGERDGRPVLSMEGRDLVLTSGTTPLVITLESPSDTFDSALPDFERFAASVKG